MQTTVFRIDRTDARAPLRPPSLARLGLRLAVLAWMVLAAAAAPAGVMNRERLVGYFPAPLVVGARDAKVPVWPITKQNGPQDELVAYVFESIDFAPVRGFAGTPVNLLVALAPSGEFLEVRVLSQHEPVFLDGLGEQPLFRFVASYRGLNLRHNIKIGSGSNQAARASSTNVFIDGVAKATASVRIVNESVIGSALAVARTKLGYAAGKDPALIARVRPDVFEPLDWAQLLERGFVRHMRLTHRDVERAFSGTAVEGVDPVATAHPDAVFTDWYVANVSVPSVGRNLLGERGFEALRKRLDDGQHAVWVMSAGRYGFVDEHFVRGSIPDRLSMRQGDLPIELRDTDLEPPLTARGAPDPGPAKIFRISAHAGFDPADPWTLALRVTREKGQIWPERVSRDFHADYALPEALFDRPVVEPPWLPAWRSRLPEIAVLTAALALLTIGLATQARFAGNARLLRQLRWAYLAFTLGFVGWYAQAQLSIVTLMGLARVRAPGDLVFLLHDPPSLILWGFVLFTLVVWGRGTFCGWLCPFGALQEFAAALARRLGVPARRLSARWDRRLEWLKYPVLAGLIGAAALAPGWADSAAEVEPFKTAITLVFQRSLPFVGYAVLLIVAGAVWYKAFCRYLCPLGAALAIGGWLRRFDWIARRAECGTPCQLCRHRCEYSAIERSGEIRYQECFQCLDCVSIYQDARRCAPLLLAARKGRRIVPLVPAGARGRRRTPETQAIPVLDSNRG